MNKPKLPTIPPMALDGFTLDVQYYIRKEYTDISEAAVELPSIIEWLNYQTQLNSEAKLMARAKLERTEAVVYYELREDGGFQQRGYGAKPTEKGLEMAVTLDDRIAELREDLAIYTALVDRLINLQRSLTFKLELVRSSEATRRRIIE